MALKEKKFCSLQRYLLPLKIVEVLPPPEAFLFPTNFSSFLFLQYRFHISTHQRIFGVMLGLEMQEFAMWPLGKGPALESMV